MNLLGTHSIYPASDRTSHCIMQVNIKTTKSSNRTALLYELPVTRKISLHVSSTRPSSDEVNIKHHKEGTIKLREAFLLHKYNKF